MGRTAASESRGGDPAGEVARAAAVALTRCGSPRAESALRKILDDRDAPVERRAVAGRQLVQGFGARGADIVARALAARPGPSLGVPLARALGRASRPTPEVKRALCEALEQTPRVAQTARQSLRTLYPEEPEICGIAMAELRPREQVASPSPPLARAAASRPPSGRSR
jgi:hypothetical protein